MYGGYTADGGDFQSTFSAFSSQHNTNSNDYGYLTAHSIDATGVPDGSMTVNGEATALAHDGGWWYGGFVEGWQSFSGEAESVTVTGEKLWGKKKYAPDWGSVTNWDGAQFTSTVTGASTATFSGDTESGTYPQSGYEGKGHEKVLNKQGLGFDVNASSTPSATLNTTYSYSVIAAFVGQVVGETATWSGLPGYAPDP
ncbi:hypothetical protein ES708_26004 [subsurface metagenome]